MAFDLLDFVRESNRIEGIHRDPTPEEIQAHAIFLSKDTIGIEDLEEFVKIVAGAPLREHSGMDVRVGAHHPMRGGPEVVWTLRGLVNNASDYSAFKLHVQYEMLHPFMDGNGRSGRVLWLWRMGGVSKAPLGFLHHFYYQTLQSYQ